MVREDATIRLFGGADETDPALAARRVECVFDLFDLASSRSAGTASRTAWQSRSTLAGIATRRPSRKPRWAAAGDRVARLPLSGLRIL